MDYRNELRGLRAKHNVSQEEAAKVLGITRVAYKNKELGVSRFYFDEVVKLLKYLDELDYLSNPNTNFFTI